MQTFNRVHNNKTRFARFMKLLFVCSSVGAGRENLEDCRFGRQYMFLVVARSRGGGAWMEGIEQQWLL